MSTGQLSLDATNTETQMIWSPHDKLNTVSQINKYFKNVLLKKKRIFLPMSYKKLSQRPRNIKQVILKLTWNKYLNSYFLGIFLFYKE